MGLAILYRMVRKRPSDKVTFEQRYEGWKEASQKRSPMLGRCMAGSRKKEIKCEQVK